MSRLLSATRALLSSANASGWTALTNVLRAMMNQHPKPYRPEVYYMRGPGPKWREKHAIGFDRASR